MKVAIDVMEIDSVCMKIYKYLEFLSYQVMCEKKKHVGVPLMEIIDLFFFCYLHIFMCVHPHRYVFIAKHAFFKKVNLQAQRRKILSIALELINFNM